MKEEHARTAASKVGLGRAAVLALIRAAGDKLEEGAAKDRGNERTGARASQVLLVWNEGQLP